MIAIGSVEVMRVVEWVGPIMSPTQILPDTPPLAWTQEFTPHHWDQASGHIRVAMQTWVLRSAGRTILVDTGIGNDRNRPQAPVFSNLNTDFLQRLQAAGVEPDDVDVVVNTHIHYDHIGWNTTLAGGKWIPTFPNATYLVPERDVNHYRPENAERMRRARNDDEERRFTGLRIAYEDSIQPIADAGQLQTWEDQHEINQDLRLALAPGHTPGSSILWVTSGHGALFAGDLLHSPPQIARPGDICGFDFDPQQGIRSRRLVLDEIARTGAMLFPAHFAGAGSVTIEPAAETFRITAWGSLPEA